VDVAAPCCDVVVQFGKSVFYGHVGLPYKV